MAGIFIGINLNATETNANDALELSANFALDCHLVGEVTNVSCHKGHNGAFTIQGSGGTGPYEYSYDDTNWTSNGNFTGLSNGYYYISVRDATGDIAYSCTYIEVVAPSNYLTCSQVGSTVHTTNGGNNGSFQVQAQGGVAPYTYSLNGAAPVSSGQFNNMAAGTYDVTVIDDWGCEMDCGVITVNGSNPSVPCNSTPCETCYAIPQNGASGGTQSSVLYSWSLSPANQYLGQLGVGTNEIETMSFGGDCNKIYGIDGGTFGEVSKSNGSFSPIFTLGNMEANGVIEQVNDVDGVAIDNNTGYFWAIERKVPANDLLFLINPVTGQIVEDVFGAGIDYVPLVGAQVDVDDIAFNPCTGELYGISTVSGATNLDQIVKINTNTGQLTVLATLDNCDLEGLTFNNNCQLFASSGYQDCVKSNSIFYIDVPNQSSTLITELGHDDVEAVTCCVSAPEPTCDNFTSPGQIGYDQSYCNSADPDEIQNIQSPSGGKGGTEYVWMKTTTNCGSAPTGISSSGWSVISGATSSSYDPSTINTTTCYARLVKRDNCDDYLVSNIVTVTTSCTDEPPTTEGYSCTDGVTVDTYGKSCNGSTATVSIPSIGNIFKSVVEVVYKGCHPGTVTVMAGGTSYTLPEVTLTGTSSDVYAFRGELTGGFSSISTSSACGSCDPHNGLQSILVYAFRNVDSGSAYSTVFSSRSGYCDVESFAMSIPTDDAVRDISLEIPITEMTPDGRYLTVKATSNVGGATASTTIYGPDTSLGCCLNIVNLTVPNVSGNATSLTIEIITDTANSPTGACGQSWVVAASFAAGIECVDCNIGCEVVGDVTNVSCHKGHNGEFTVQGTGGAAPYEYSLNGGAYSSQNTFSGLQNGTYYVSVKDANGCEEVDCTVVQITEPPAYLTCYIFPNPEMVSCEGGSDGSFRVKGNNGTPGYSFSLNGGAAVSNGTAEYEFSGLEAGSYTVTIIDANGCEVECDAVVISEPDVFICDQVSVQNISVFGANDGALEVQGVGGTSPYTYSLNGATPVMSGAFASLSAGTYSVEITDANDCTVTCGDITIEEGVNDLSCNEDHIQAVDCFGNNTGSITITATGGGVDIIIVARNFSPES